EAELQDVRWLLGARELRVDRLVTPRAERGRPLDSLQEIGSATPIVVDERRLVDHLGAGAHRLNRRSRPGLEVPRIRRPDVDDVAALASQVRQVGGLVLLAFLGEQLAIHVGDARPGSLPPRNLLREGRQVFALHVVVQIGGGKNEAIGDELHGRELLVDGPDQPSALAVARAPRCHDASYHSRAAPPPRLSACAIVPRPNVRLSHLSCRISRRVLVHVLSPSSAAASAPTSRPGVSTWSHSRRTSGCWAVARRKVLPIERLIVTVRRQRVILSADL